MREKKPKILLIPPPELPVPAVRGGAVETLITHLIRENERQQKLEFVCASIPDPEAKAAAATLAHTKMLYVARPHGHRRYWPMVFVERCFGVAAPYDPWYQKVQLALALELPPPDLIVAEGGTLTQCSAISKMFGRRKCLAHLHGQTAGSREMDAIYGGVLALSEFIRTDYLKTSSLPPQNAYILHNCVDTARFAPAPADFSLRDGLGFSRQDFVVLFCGRLEPDKGIHKLLEALSLTHHPNIKLLIVGSPFFGRSQSSTFLKKLESQAHALGNRVKFTGYLQNESLPAYYHLADLVCVPTLVEEAAGLVAVEAMACGRPLLATRSGGMPEYLQGSQAVLVDRGRGVAEQLAWAMDMLLEHPDMRAEMGRAGVVAAQKFSVATFYQKFVQILTEFGATI
ncbi:MAG: glycosyltransferase family 4 protein [Gemmiger sp.]|nr:glycosyltransferase family 4 protein [Gemmiger sp.]